MPATEIIVTKRGLIVGILVALLAQSVPSFAPAQSANAADSSLRLVITRISARQSGGVRLSGQGIGRVRAKGLQLNGDSVLLISEQSTRSVALGEIDSLWVRGGNASLILGIVAGVPCAIYGGLLGAFLATDPDSNGRPGRGPVGALIGGAAGGLACGLVGAGIGSLIKRWRLEFARPMSSRGDR